MEREQPVIKGWTPTEVVPEKEEKEPVIREPEEPRVDVREKVQVFRIAVLGFEVIKKQQREGWTTELLPLVMDEEGNLVKEIDRARPEADVLVGVLPAPSQTFAVVGREVGLLGYEFVGAKQPNWLEILERRKLEEGFSSEELGHPEED